MKCSRCKEDKLPNEFVKGMAYAQKNGAYGRCKPCHRIENARITKERKLIAISHYSADPEKPMCSCKGCGQDMIEFLVLDHIDGGGNDHRRSIRNSSMYLWVKQNGYPSGFRVLCWNCNNSRGCFGYCPHESESIFPKGLLRDRGRKVPENSKLSAEAVVEILTALKAGETQKSLASRYSVNPSLIGRIKRGVGWAHVPR